MPELRVGYRAALRVPTARRLWLASLASTVGDYIGLGALLFLAADATGRVLGAAVVLAVGVVPSLFTGLVAGRWLDRFHRGRTLAVLQVAGAVIICLPVLIDGVAIVFVTAALLAGLRIATVSVRSGAMAEGLEDRHRGPLVALLASTDQAAQVFGFLTGGALYVLVGVDAALLLDAATFTLGAIILSRLALPRPSQRSVAPPMLAGLRDIVHDPVLRLLGGLVAVTGLVASLPETLAPAIAGPGDPWRPIVLAASPAGQVLAMTILGRLPAIRRPVVQLWHFTALALALLAATLAVGPASFALANLAVGAGTGWIIGPQVTFLRRAPAVRMAQITGTMIAALALAEGLGSLVLAGVADRFGPTAAYGVAGVVLLVAALGAWWQRGRTPALTDLDAHGLSR